jgi:hypothetical protein
MDTALAAKLRPLARRLRRLLEEGRPMPFKKVGRNRYRSPSGRIFTKKQVALYHATGGFKRPPRKRRSR